MKFNNCSAIRTVLPLVACLSLSSWAQSSSPTSLNSLSAVVSFTAPEKLIVKRNATGVADVVIQVKSGFHVNSTKPDDAYLIPLRFTWAEDVVKVEDVTYPSPKMEKFPFSEKPLSVFDGNVKTQTRFRVPADAKPGLTALNGKLRYQACNDRMCLPPRTLDVKIPLDIRN